jgi:hypothetical protein
MSDRIDPRQIGRALNAWARADGRGLRTGGGHGALVGSIQFHWRPDPRGPESFVTLEATSIDGHPGIRVTTSETRPSGRAPSKAESVIARMNAPDDSTRRGREPDAVCEGCGAVGTIGRAARTDATGRPTETHRFCRDCWPEQSARYRARWKEQERLSLERVMRGIDAPVAGVGPGMFFEAATWHSVLELVRELEQSLRAPMSLSADDLGTFADEIRRNASLLDDEMPWEVEAFLDRYGANS